jgi:hypothetical protein
MIAERVKLRRLIFKKYVAAFVIKSHACDAKLAHLVAEQINDG